MPILSLTRDRNAGQPPRTPLPAITEKFQGQQFVAVGSRLLFDAKWQTFHDFLFTYLGAVFEKEWFAAELRQPLETRQPLMQWYETLHEFDAARRTPAERGQVLRIDEPPAEVSALLSFAYAAERVSTKLHVSSFSRASIARSGVPSKSVAFRT